jgi:hypothetical protein
MAPVAQKLLVIDPLTLMGREVMSVTESRPDLVGEFSYCHTADDDEHQIAELAGTPALIPPLTGTADFAQCSAVLVASDTDTSRLSPLFAHMDDDPLLPVIDVARSASLADRCRPAAGAADSWPSAHIRVAHPALVVLSNLVSSLRHLVPTGATVTAVDPVSSLGGEAIEALARQAAQRLQGSPVEEMIEGNVLAFNVVASTEGILQADAAIVVPGLDVAIGRATAGCFHGHAVYLGLAFDEPVDETAIWETITADEFFDLRQEPLSLDTTPETNTVAMTPPRLSHDRKHVAICAMVDGLRIGGALTALDILGSVLGARF